MKHSTQKYLASMTIATGVLFSPMLTGAVSAQGGPAPEASQPNDNKITTNTHVSYFSQGSRGVGVEELQASLQEKGYTLDVDGMFGNDTENAVRNYQGDHNLQVDGFAGPETRQALSLTASTETVKDESVTISEEPEGQSNQAANQSDVVSVANSLLGSPYVSGGTTPAGFDSSGFINYVFNQVGISLDRTHASMWANNGQFVDNPSVGDVVFFENTYKSGVSHSGIYIGNNQMIHAGTPQTGVEVTDMGYDYWSSRYIGAKSFR